MAANNFFLVTVFGLAIIMFLAAALASVLRGRRFIHQNEPQVRTAPLSEAGRTTG